MIQFPWRTALLWILLPIILPAQDGTVPLGGDASGPGGSFAFSTGQVCDHNTTSVAGYSNEGIQQPYEILITEVESPVPDFGISVFPNPAGDFLHLHVNGQDWLEVDFRLFTVQGVLCREGAMPAPDHQMDLSGLSAGSYILQFLQRDIIVQTFKVLKSK